VNGSQSIASPFSDSADLRQFQGNGVAVYVPLYDSTRTLVGFGLVTWTPTDRNKFTISKSSVKIHLGKRHGRSLGTDFDHPERAK